MPPIGTQCSVQGCDRNVHAKTLCKSHYETQRKTGCDPQYPVGRRLRGCSVAGCSAKHFCRGYCASHYSRFHRYGDPLKTPTLGRPRVEKRQCRIDGCAGHGRTKGLCPAHYQRLLRYGDPAAGGVFKGKMPLACQIAGCDRPAVAKSFCAAHYAKWKKHGDANFRSDWAMRRNEKIVDTQGYVLVHVGKHPNATRSGRVPEHRYVMSQAIGRPLLPDEHVHHVNGVRSDNRLENLELWVTTQPAGQRPKDLVTWAKKILLLYDNPKLRKV